ncbi:MAG: hemerythrin domain-containing protein [Ilumatobacteraceae bacterium]
MDALTLLRSDHQMVEQLFKRFEKAGDRALVEKRHIVDRIIEELSIHAAIEEQVFYPVARATVPDTEGIALESLEEHHIVKWLLSELVDLDPAHERFDAKVTVLIENVRHHVKEEQDDFFPKVRKALGRKALADLGEALAQAKKSAPTHPHPRAGDAPPINAVVGVLTGVADRVGDNLSGIAQGGVTAAQELISRLRGSKKPVSAPTGSTVARKRANEVRHTALAAAEGVERTATSVVAGAADTARSAKSGSKGTATTARKSLGATATTAKRAATTTTHTAKKAVANTRSTAKKSAAKTSAAARGR